jgi:hyperosmotically inducible periplasmic protein
MKLPIGFRSLSAAAALLVAQICAADNPPSTAHDNTKANQSVASHKDQTADGQSNARSDLEVTQRIRRSVMADDALSTYAHNIKIVTVNGQVTLSGVVRSEDEKAIVAATAVKAAGMDKVVNQLSVAPTQ